GRPELRDESRCEIGQAQAVGGRARGGGMAELPEREAQDVRVQRVVGVVRELRREAGLAEALQEPLHVPQARRSRLPRARRSDREAARPRVAQERLVGGHRAGSHRGAPVHVPVWKLDLVDDEVDDAVDEVALVGDVVVQRHRLDAEGGRELAHRERLDPALVGEPQGGGEDALPAEGGAARHVDKLTLYVYLTPYAYNVYRGGGRDDEGDRERGVRP